MKKFYNRCTGTGAIITFNHEYEVFNLCYSPRTMLMHNVMQDQGKQQTLNPENLWLKFILIHSKSTCGPFFCSFSPIYYNFSCSYIRNDRLRGSHRNSKTQFHDFSMIFHDQQCNFHDYLMHGLQPPLLAASSPH